MWETVISMVVALLAFGFFLAMGIACTFYTAWVQRVLSTGRLGSPGDSFYSVLSRKAIQSRYFIWHARGSGIISLLAAAVTLFGIIRGLTRALLSPP